MDSREDKIELLKELELLRRQKAAQRLIPFCQYVSPQYVADPIHYLIADHLEAVERGDIKRLMIFTPPQIGKSTLVSVHFPAWYLGKHPDIPIMLVSYADDLASEHSRNSRNLVDGELYAELFPGRHTAQDKHAANRWKIWKHQGGMLAAGVGSGITGHPARMGIVDDPIKGTDWAFSEAQLESLWRFYINDFRQRLSEDAPIILTMTRWAEGDIPGRILKSAEAEDWTVLRVPALSEADQEERDRNNQFLGLPTGLSDPLDRPPGVTCCPSRYSTEYYRKIKTSGLEWLWSAIYEGIPHPVEGTEIKRSWFKIVTEVPRDLIAKIRYWDKAGTKGAGARTAGVRISMDRQGIVYIEDVVSGQWGIAERNNIIKQTAALDAVHYTVPDPDHPELPPSALPGYNSVTIYLEQEPGSGGKESAELSVQDLAGYPVYADPVSGAASKPIRAQPFISYASAGNVRLVQGAWNQLWLNEAAAWPTGTFKDQIDATSGGFNKLKRGGFGLGIISSSPNTSG